MSAAHAPLARLPSVLFTGPALALVLAVAGTVCDLRAETSAWSSESMIGLRDDATNSDGGKFAAMAATAALAPSVEVDLAEPDARAAHVWRLSIINGGHARREAAHTDAALAADQPWPTIDAPRGVWRFRGAKSPEVTTFEFGPAGGLPLAADFNGDGVAEACVYDRGQWYIDLNGDRDWNEHDLWVRLGGASDAPVAGDWDGDGKADIGVFGACGNGALAAAAVDPGLPDPMNRLSLPRHDQTNARRAAGNRTMRLTAQGAAHRATVDHVFQFGVDGDLPLAADWNASSIAKPSVFRAGRWILDVDGDGRFGRNDRSVRFGEEHDRALAGDFDGDGQVELAVFRDGVWYIDANADQVLSDDDLIVEWGATDDLPVVADIDGDGLCELGLFSRDRAMP